MHISIVNASTLVADDDAHALGQAEAHALSQFAHAWDLAVPRVETVAAAGARQEYDEGECLVVLVDDADQAGALGYHAATPDGRPYAVVFVRDSVAALDGADPASLTGPLPLEQLLRALLPVVDHEGKEMTLDPDAADMVDDGAGTLWAKEACDAVEAGVLLLDVKLRDGREVVATVSNHVLPDYFRPGSPGPWDAAGSLTGPFALDAGGYAIYEQAGQLGQVFGDAVPAAKRKSHEDAMDLALGPDAASAVEVASRTGWRTIARVLEAAQGGPSAIAGADPDAAVIPPQGAETVEPAVPDPAAEPVAEEPVAVELLDEPAEHPEPHPGPGAGTALVQQDNVSDPGTQTTRRVVLEGDAAGQVEESAHTPDDAVPDPTGVPHASPDLNRTPPDLHETGQDEPSGPEGDDGAG